MKSGRTGDLRNNLTKLLREIQRMKLHIEPNVKRLSQGVPSAFLPILHSALMEFSLPLAQHIAAQGVEMYGRTDLRFVEGLYKIMRDVFQYRPQLTKEQFLTTGFAERKIILTFDLLCLCQNTHVKLETPPKKSYSLGSVPKTKYPSTSSVHSLANTAGIGSVWQEKLPKTIISYKECHNLHLPPSPPLTPFQNLSPTVITGPPLRPEPQLELTPLSTPVKSHPQRQDQPPNNETSTMNGCGQESETVINRCDLESNVSDLSTTPEMNCSDRNGVNYTPNECLVHETNKIESPENEQEVVTVHCEEENHLTEQVTKKTEQLSRLVETLTGRLILLETQIKIIEGQRVLPPAPPPQCVDAATQTDNSFINYLHLQTTPPNIRTEANQPTPPNYHTVSSSLFAGMSQSSLSRTVLSLSPPSSTPQSQSVTPTKSLFTPPELSNPSHTPFRTPDDTREIIRNLRSRAQKTKELLSNTNHTHRT